MTIQQSRATAFVGIYSSPWGEFPIPARFDLEMTDLRKKSWWWVWTGKHKPEMVIAPAPANAAFWRWLDASECARGKA
jgi:hypothetical protein